jgi:small subunit ribosomal protein S17
MHTPIAVPQVTVERLAPHTKYFKRIRQTKRFLAHVEPEGLAVSVGDYVRLEGTRPLSANKRFKVAEVIRAADN